MQVCKVIYREKVAFKFTIKESMGSERESFMVLKKCYLLIRTSDAF